VEPGKLFYSFVWAFRGIGYLFRTQQNARVQLLAGVLAVAVGAVLGLTTAEWALLALAIAAVLSAEATNTVVEVTLDHLSPEEHPEVRKAKDVAAGAVLLVSAGALTTGLLLFLPKLVALWAGKP
jgi:diacylglycerol kinase